MSRMADWTKAVVAFVFMVIIVAGFLWGVVKLATGKTVACRDRCVSYGFHHGWIRHGDCICLIEVEVIDLEAEW